MQLMKGGSVFPPRGWKKGNHSDELPIVMDTEGAGGEGAVPPGGKAPSEPQGGPKIAKRAAYGFHEEEGTMYYEDEGWLSPEMELALDEIERLDSFSELEEDDGDTFEDVAASRWDDEDLEEDDLEADATDEAEDW